MKKSVSIILIFCLFLCCLSLIACDSLESDKTSIVCTIIPEYDWVLNVLGDEKDNFNITCLCSNGVDVHSYQASINDTIKISTCDMFIYAGGESQEWVDDVLANAKKQDKIVIKELDVIGDRALIEEEINGEEHEDHEHEEELDEHVWLSLINAKLVVGEIAKQLGVLDPANKDKYLANANAYNSQLSSLDENYKETISSSSKKLLLFGDRFPFRYMVEDYSLSYYAAFSGCSTEVNASVGMIIDLAKKVDENNLSTVLKLEDSDGRIAQKIMESSSATQVLTLDSMQAITMKKYNNGHTYLYAMTQNLDVIKLALK